MRVIVVVLGIVAVLVWLGIELRPRARNVSALCFGLAAIFGALLIGAWFGLYGA